MLKGQVGDDAKVQYVEGDLSTVAERNGTDVPTSLRRRRSQFRFTLSRDEFYPGLPTNITPISETSWDIEGAAPQENNFASDAAAAVMLWGRTKLLGCRKGMVQAEHLRRNPFYAPYQDKKVCFKRIDSGEDGTSHQEGADGGSREVQGGEREAKGG